MPFLTQPHPYDFVSKTEYVSQGNKYAVEFWNYKEWAKMEPGFARVCYLYCNGQKIFKVIDDMGWCKVSDYSPQASVRTDDCLVFCQKNNVDVIILEGYPYESQPRIVVIAVQGNQAKIVSFTDQKFHIESVTKAPDGYFEIRLEDDWPELGNDRCTTPGCYTMKATAEGMFLYKEDPEVYAVRKMLVDFFFSYQTEWAKKNCDERKLLALRESYCTRGLLSKIAQEGDMIKALSVGAVCDDDEWYRFVEAKKDGDEEGLYNVFYRKYKDHPEVCISVTVVKEDGVYKIASLSPVVAVNTRLE